MSDKVYRDMLDVINSRFSGIPAVDIPEFYSMTKVLFTPEEAEINNAMPQGSFTTEALAQIMGKPETELATQLKTMAEKGLCSCFVKDGVRVFRGFGFVIGMFDDLFGYGRITNSKAINKWWKLNNPTRGVDSNQGRK